MKRMFVFTLLCLMGLLPLLQQGADTDPEYYAHYLTPVDLQKITGLTGITTRHQYSLHFLDKAGREILIVRFGPEKRFERETRREKYWTPIEGVADRAKIAIPQMPYQLALVKGIHFAMVVSLTDPESGKIYLSVDQLKAVATLVASRMDPQKAL